MKNYFKNCLSIDEAKKLYRELAKVLHPDKGGSNEAMQALNLEFEKFIPSGKEKFNGEHSQWNSWTAREYAHIIEELIKIPEIIVEICGSFIWVSGNTKPYKDQIRAIETGKSYKQALFAGKKQAWYFSPSGYRKFTSGSTPMNKIRTYWGSEFVEKTETLRLKVA